MWISLLDLKRAFVIHLLLSHHSFVAGFGAYIPDDDPYEFVRALDCPEYVKAAMCRAAGCQWDKPTGVCTHWPLQNSLGKITPPKRPEETLTPTTYPSFPPTPVKTKMPSIWTPSSRPSLLRPPTKMPTRIPTEATSTTAAVEPATQVPSTKSTEATSTTTAADEPDEEASTSTTAEQTTTTSTSTTAEQTTTTTTCFIPEAVSYGSSGCVVDT